MNVRLYSCLILGSLFFLGGCSLLPQSVQDSFSQAQEITNQTIENIKDKTKDIKENLVILIGNAEVTALPAVQNFQNLVVEGLTSLQKGATTQDTTIQCLQKKGVTYYTSRTCAFALQQRDLLGNDLDALDRVRCDESKDLVACLKRGVQGTPAFGSNDGKLIHGVQTLDSLAQTFGCK